MNAYELVNNWTKLEFLTSLCYPLGYQGGDLGSVSAPIIFLLWVICIKIDFHL